MTKAKSPKQKRRVKAWIVLNKDFKPMKPYVGEVIFDELEADWRASESAHLMSLPCEITLNPNPKRKSK